MRKGRAFQAERTDFAKCRACEQHVWAVGAWSVEPQAHLGSRRVLKHEASAGALNPVAGVLIKRGHRHREEVCGKTETTVMLSPTKEHQGLTTATRSQGGGVGQFLLQSSRRNEPWPPEL